MSMASSTTSVKSMSLLTIYSFNTIWLPLLCLPSTYNICAFLITSLFFLCDQRNATQRNATQRNATQRNATQRNATQRNATQRNATQRNATQRNATQRNATQRNATQRNATQRNATQRNATQRNATTQHSAFTVPPFHLVISGCWRNASVQTRLLDLFICQRSCDYVLIPARECPTHVSNKPTSPTRQ